MAAPADDGFFGIIVARIVIFGHGDGLSLLLIPQIFRLQGQRIILRMAGDENMVAVLTHHSIDPRFIRGCQDFQSLRCLDILPPDGGMAGMGHIEGIVKAPQQNGALVVRVMGIDAKELFLQRLFFDAIVVVLPVPAPAMIRLYFSSLNMALHCSLSSFILGSISL